MMGDVDDLLVVTGPPGAGKSTLASKVSGMFLPSARVAGDDFFAFVDQGYLPPWFIELFLAATGLDSLHYVVLSPPEPYCIERVRTRGTRLH